MVRLLLIDENEKDIASFKHHINKIDSLNISLVHVPTFEEAILLADTFEFNVLVSEIHFKKIRGKEVVKRLYKHFQYLPIVICTNHFELRHHLDLHISADMLEKRALTPLLLEKTIMLAYQKYLFRNEKQKMLYQIEEKQQKINRTDRQIEELAYTLSHDLRGPLGSILGLSELIKENNISTDEIKDFNKMINTSANKLNGLLEQLLGVLLSSQNIYEHTQEIEIEQEIEYVSQKVKETFPDVSYQIKINNEAKQLPYSQTAFHFLMYNLLSNAVKFRSPRRPLNIKVESKLVSEEFYCISVEDNGSGMDMESVRPRLFKIFKRFHPNVEGKGLGLYAVKTMLDELGGKIEVNSVPNQGTEFKAYLKPIRILS